MEWPQIQTTITDGNAISTVVDAPWVSVTSLNGMTGDVIVEPIIKPFQSNHYYLKDSVITHDGSICFARQTFTSGGSFNINDWEVPDFTQEQADWNENDSTAKSYIKNKPTIPTVNNGTLTVQKNGTSVATFTANQSGNTTANIVTNELVTKADTRSSMLPSTVVNGNKSSTYFTSMNALDSQTSGGGYADALLLSTWSDASGGRVNALVVTKQNDQKLYHYTGTYNGSSWSGKKEIAYTDAIPTVNNATLTIQKNATTIDTFTANSATNKTVNIVVPTDTGDLTNNAGYLKADDVYPVGSIVTFYDTADHSNFLGLSWVRFAAGKMVVGYDSTDSDFNSVGNTGGEKTHTLTTDEMPSHYHGVNTCYNIVGSNTTNAKIASAGAGAYWNNNPNNSERSIQNAGGGQAHNNMPPYITAALWRRTA